MFDEKELDRLLKSTDKKDRVARLELSETTNDELVMARLVEDKSIDNHDVRRVIASRSKNPDTLRKMVNFKDELSATKIDLFDNEYTPKDAILELSKDEDFELSAHIALWTLDEEVLANLANHKNMGIKIEVAETTKNADTLRKLAFECNNELLGSSIAENTHDTSVLTTLMDNKSVNTKKMVLDEIAKNANDEELLLRVVESDVKSARTIAKNRLKAIKK